VALTRLTFEIDGQLATISRIIPAKLAQRRRSHPTSMMQSVCSEEEAELEIVIEATSATCAGLSKHCAGGVQGETDSGV
jgi:hypothetical protein